MPFFGLLRPRSVKAEAPALLPPPPGLLQRWSTAELGDEAIATVRCIVAIPGGVALGSDYGLSLWREGRFERFPWPAGARREARRVEAMTLHEGQLYVGTSQNIFMWDFKNPVRWTRHGRDEEDGWDDICSLHSAQGILYQGFRTRFYGAEGPPDVLCMTTDPQGVTWLGTREGELWKLGEKAPFRHFADPRYDGKKKGRPIRHLAWAQGALWVAAQEQLHRWDGEHWSSARPEPTFLLTDQVGKLWGLGDGRLLQMETGWLRPVNLPIERPWSLCATADSLWIGGRERVWRLQFV